jgi:hypothetical protein
VLSGRDSYTLLREGVLGFEKFAGEKEGHRKFKKLRIPSEVRRLGEI